MIELGLKTQNLKGGQDLNSTRKNVFSYEGYEPIMSSQKNKSGSCWKEARKNVEMLVWGLITEGLEK